MIAQVACVVLPVKVRGFVEVAGGYDHALTLHLVLHVLDHGAYLFGTP